MSELGPPINTDVAVAITRLYQHRQPKESLEKIRSECKLPENCKSISVPKVNPEVWSVMPQRGRQSDFSLQVTQQQVTTASIILAKITETLFDADASKLVASRQDLLKSSLEALTVLGGLTQDINQKRKNEIRPFLNKDISAICSAASSTELLFGDNLADQLKNAKATTSIIRTTQAKSFYKPHRFTPYKTSVINNSLNWRGSPQMNRGNFRGRGTRGRRPNHQQSPRHYNNQ